MSALLSSLSPKSDSDPLSAYQTFVDNVPNNVPAQGTNDVIFQIAQGKNGKTIKGGATNTVLQRVYRFLFGQKKSSIVEDFEQALNKKFGPDIANFVFPTTIKQEALNKGLNKAVIRKALETAEKLQETQLRIATLQEKAPSAEILRKVVRLQQQFHAEIKKSSLNAKTVNFVQINDPTANIEKEIAELEKDIQTHPEASKTITPESLKQIEAELDDYLTTEGVEKLVPGTSITGPQLLATLEYYKTKHERIAEALVEKIRSNPVELEHQIQEAVTAVITTLTERSEALQMFSAHLQGEEKGFFYLNEQGTIAVNQDPSSKPSREKNKPVWESFFKALAGFYGEPILEEVVSSKERKELFSTPLTLARAKLFLERSHQLLARDLIPLNSDPLLVTEKFVEALRNDRALLEASVSNTRSSSSQIARSLLNIGVLAFTSHIGLAIPIIPLALAVSALSGAIGGIITTRREDGSLDPSIVPTAAAQSATLVTGGVGGQLLGEALCGYLGTAVFGAFKEPASFVITFAFNSGGAYLTDAVRSAFLGGNVSGSQAALRTRESSSEHLTPDQITDAISLEGNTLHLVALLTERVGDIASHIPIDPTAISDRTHLSPL